MVKTLLAFVLLVSSAFAQVCKPNQYDMLQWMMPQGSTSDAGPKQTNYFVNYPETGTFYWVKGAAGFPWDVKSYDTNFIYDWRTEETWNDPNTYKEFEHPLPMMPRCIDIPSTPGKLTAIPTPPAYSKFDIHSSCTGFYSQDLSYVMTEVWGPKNETISPVESGPTLTNSYRYNCDNQYSQCSDKETFELQQGIGLVRWTHYKLENNVYSLVNQTTFLAPGTATTVPVHPCW